MNRIKELKKVVLITAAWLELTRFILAQTAPTITSQPGNVLATAGGTAMLTLGASGTSPLAYSWYFNGSPVIFNGMITTVAGNGTNSFSGDGGPAINASLDSAQGVALDSAGNLFIADAYGRIRKVTTNGFISTVAGNGTNGFSGDGGPATNASFFGSSAVTVDAAGDLMIADTSNYRIRKVDTNGVITTIAGNGNVGFSGDGGAATNARLFYPEAVALQATGSLFLSDENNNRVRKVDAGGIITTVAGNGNQNSAGDGGPAINASVYHPAGLALDAMGNLFIACPLNQRVRKVDVNGIITVVAGGGSGGDGGAATNASLSFPGGLAVDASGNLFIADGVGERIRKVDNNGIITTVAGNGSQNYSGDGGAATSASLNSPQGLAVDANGNLFIADLNNRRIRKVAASNVTLGSAGASLAISNLNFGNFGNYFVVVSNAFGSVTSSVASVVLQPQFTSVAFSNLDFFMACTGAPSGNYVVEYTTNFASGQWIPLATNTANANGNTAVLDTNTAGFAAKFYRVSAQ